MTGKGQTAHAGDDEPFDQYRASYEMELERGLSATGDNAAYYLNERVEWLARHLRARGMRASRVLDYGCGNGNAAPVLLERLGATAVLGLDVSAGLLARAVADYGSPSVRFEKIEEFSPDTSCDVAYCNGVFHHIVPAARDAAVRLVHACLRPGGLFAFWENNPWNPGTRYVMSRIEFDRDAITLSPMESRRLLTTNGFEILGTSSRFYFPRPLRLFRRLEQGLLSVLPLGGQYQVLCRKR